MAKDKSFSEFQEADITFAPTYKFKINTNIYDTSRNRLPSWCDRILYKIMKENHKVIECVPSEYNHVDEINLSDHKPVFAMFDIKVLESIFKRAFKLLISFFKQGY